MHFTFISYAACVKAETLFFLHFISFQLIAAFQALLACGACQTLHAQNGSLCKGVVMTEWSHEKLEPKMHVRMTKSHYFNIYSLIKPLPFFFPSLRSTYRGRVDQRKWSTGKTCSLGRALMSPSGTLSRPDRTTQLPSWPLPVSYPSLLLLLLSLSSLSLPSFHSCPYAQDWLAARLRNTGTISHLLS